MGRAHAALIDAIVEQGDCGIERGDLRLEGSDLRFQAADASGAVAVASQLVLSGAIHGDRFGLRAGAAPLGVSHTLLIFALGDQTGVQ
jgi:hypothetical protein